MAGEFVPSEEARKYYKNLTERTDVLMFVASTAGGQGARSVNLSTFERFLPQLIDTAAAIYQGTKNASSALIERGETDINPEIVRYLRALSDQYAQQDAIDREVAGFSVTAQETDLGVKGITRLKLMVPVRVLHGTVDKLSQTSPPPSSGFRK